MTMAARITLLCVPAVCFVVGFVTARTVTHLAEHMTVEPVTLLDAAARGDNDAIDRMVSAGEDPGMPVVLQQHLFDWPAGEVTSPYLVAIARGKLTDVAYMAKHTQRLIELPNDQALCIAARFGTTKMVRFLMTLGVPAAPKDGCDEGGWPEDIAAKYGFGRLSKELHEFRTQDP